MNIKEILQNLQENKISVEEAALAVTTDKGDDIVYISVMNNLSVDCDCDSNPAEPDMHDMRLHYVCMEQFLLQLLFRKMV